MTEGSSIPTGRLQSVERDWEYQSGWVRTPLREIAFNDRLSKQARLLWQWLASVPPGSAYISWGECETVLRCGTKARRNCLSQLVTEGFISISDNGVVIMNDPYLVYNETRKRIIDEIREEWQEEIEIPERGESNNQLFSTIALEKGIDDEINKISIAKEKPKPKAKPKPESIQIIIDSWNQCKPETYSSMRTVSTKQKECISKHMSNLGLSSENTKDFICSVCEGLKKSDFWSKRVDQSGRNFNSVFGYGSPQDTKMKNIENLYSAGNEATPVLKEKVPVKYNKEQQEIIDAYRFIMMNLNSAKARDDVNETERYNKLLEITLEDIKAANVDMEDLK